MSKINSKSFGIVVYMDDSMYEDDPKFDRDIHFPITKEQVLLNLLKSFYDNKIGNNNLINEIVVGHEHGTENGKCHMQIFISFESKIRKMIKPNKFTVDGINYLYMAQSTKTPQKLRKIMTFMR